MSQYPSENISFFSEQEDYTAKKSQWPPRLYDDVLYELYDQHPVNWWDGFTKYIFIKK